MQNFQSFAFASLLKIIVFKKNLELKLLSFKNVQVYIYTVILFCFLLLPKLASQEISDISDTELSEPTDTVVPQELSDISDAELSEPIDTVVQQEIAVAEEQGNSELKTIHNSFWNGYSAMMDILPAGIFLGNSSFADKFTESTNIQSKYGFKINIEGIYRNNYFNVGLHTNYEFFPFSFTDDETLNSYFINSAIGTPLLKFPVCFNIGYKSFTIAGKNNVSVSTNLFSKVGCISLGASVEHFRINDSFDFSAKIVWLPLSFFDPLIITHDMSFFCKSLQSENPVGPASYPQTTDTSSSLKRCSIFLM